MTHEATQSKTPVAAGPRDYAGLQARLIEACRGIDDRTTLMSTVVELLWETLGDARVSWLGFYVYDAESDSMLLSAREPKPACSPIGMHGACGRSFLERRAIVVGDVSALGDGYIACDPKDLSELVLPLFDPDGSAWGVLDLDSYDRDSFTPLDVAGLRDAMIAAGLSHALEDGLSLLVI